MHKDIKSSISIEYERVKNLLRFYNKDFFNIAQDCKRKFYG
jgi:hypothetical protein